MIFRISPSQRILFRVIYSIVVGASVLCLGSCVKYDDITSHHKLALPAQFPSQKTIHQQQGQWPKQDWATQFHDPQLTALIMEALTNNPDIAVAKAHVAAASALADSKKSELLPHILGQGQVARGRLSATLFPPILGNGGSWFNFGESLFILTYDLDLWGKNIANFRQALSNEKASEAEKYATQLTIATAVAMTYNRLAYYETMRGIFLRTVKQRTSLDAIAEKLLHSGLNTKVQLYQSHNQTADAKTQLVQIEGQIQIIRQQLGALVGGGPDRGLTIKSPRLVHVTSPTLPTNLPLHLIARRPDIVGARWVVEASSQGIKNAKAQFYPDVNLFALAGFLTLNLDRLFENASRQYQVGPIINLPIFEAGALRAQLKGRYAIYAESVAQYNSTLNKALTEVASALTTISSLDKQISSQKQALYAANQAYTLAKGQYQFGLASQLVVLTAETSYLNEQQTQAQLIYNRRDAQISLIKALGGGFEGELPHQFVPNCCHPKSRIGHE